KSLSRKPRCRPPSVAGAPLILVESDLFVGVLVGFLIVKAVAPTTLLKMLRDFHSPGRSAVFACDGMAAPFHPSAGQVDIDTLKAGGPAGEAAVAAAATLAVVEPHMTGIGGDCFCLVAKPGVPIWGYNGSGRAAAAARAEILWDAGVRAIGHD